MKKFYKILVFLWAASILNAATTYVSTITGTRVVTGYFNLINSVSVIITLDGDLQNDPNDIPLLISEINNGYDLICGWRFDRKDKLINRKIPSKIANKLIAHVTGLKLHDYGCSLKAFKKEIIEEIGRAHV